MSSSSWALTGVRSEVPVTLVPGPLDALHQVRSDGIGHRGDENGNVLDDMRGGLGRRGRDGQDQIDAVGLKLAGDGLRRRQVALRALNVVRDVGAFGVAQLAQTIDEPLPGLVQRGMLHDLGDAHLDGGRLGADGEGEQQDGRNQQGCTSHHS